MEIQIGKAVGADFEENTFTFEMENQFTVRAGKYAIIDIRNCSIVELDKLNSFVEELSK